jgi:chromosome segregation ATPase
MPTPKEIEQDLKNLADEIDRAKESISRGKGRLEGLESQLSKLGIDSEDKAEEKVKQLRETEEKLGEEISDNYADLKSKFAW